MADPLTMVGNFLLLLILIAIWDLVWKGVALWKSARNSQKVWYVLLLVVNSAGILPIIYLLWFQKKKTNKKN